MTFSREQASHRADLHTLSPCGSRLSIFMTYKTYVEIKIEVEFSATPYDPGVCSGPPEKCYPPEGGEVEITSVTFKDKPIELPDEDMAKLQEEIEQKVAEGEFDGEPDYDTWDEGGL